MHAKDATYNDIPFLDDLVRFYEQSPLGLQAGSDKMMPGADIFCWGSAGTTKRLATLVNVLCMMRRPDKSSPFSRIVVVYPLASAETLATLKDRLCAAAVTIVTRLHGDEAGAGFNEFLRDVLRVTTFSSLDVNAASALVDTIDPGAAVIFVEAARYRQIGLSVERADGEPSARIAEDRWVHHLRAFANSCVAAARRRESYVVLDAGHLSPYRAENREVLQSVSG